MCCVHGGEGGQHTKIKVSTLKLEDRGARSGKGQKNIQPLRVQVEIP
jgi:hypothetical protein